MTHFKRYLPWAAALLALVAALVAMVPKGHVRGFDIDGFGSLPVLEGGRVKPLDSVARNSLLMIRSQQSFAHEGRTLSADEWMLDVLFRPEVASAEKMFVINDPDVLGLIGKKQTADRYFAFNDLSPYLGEIEKQGQAVHAIDAKERTRFQSAIGNLYDRIYLFYRLRNTVQLDGGMGLRAEIQAQGAANAAERREELTSLAHFRILPPLHGQKADAWRNSGEALAMVAQVGKADPGLDALARLGSAYAANDAATFNAALGDFRRVVQASRPEANGKADAEHMFNRAEPFYLGMEIYVLALLLLFASWLWQPELLRKTAFGLLSAGAIVHTSGLIARVILQGRPPVTNLYSSAVFVGWSAVLVGILLERIYRKGFGTAVAAASGFASLIVAHHLAGDGDTMEMMRAVLDSNFWLATHVVTITIGYSGAFLAGGIAIAYTLRKQIARKLDPATSKTLVSMTYGVLAFALFFSFLGTVLGGIWADQSWGRFWGWDPKENGALLIVLWNALILHARWGGFVREKGIMAMAIFGNVITSLSWFGVNMLGVGLHSYGFMDKAFWALATFIGTQLVLMALCLLPPRFWKRASVTAAVPAAATTAPRHAA
jgi:ABC-type transport system involved in cytochrome c biogenesis permease subunit